jgi:hypothetical protein
MVIDHYLGPPLYELLLSIVNNTELLTLIGEQIPLLKSLDLAALAAIEQTLQTKLNVSVFQGHTHEINQVIGLLQVLESKLENADLEPITLALASKAPVNHTHNEYALTDHTHPISEVEGLGEVLNGKQAAGSYATADHGHGIAAIAGLTEALETKAPTTHAHTIAQVDGLTEALGSKAASAHDHTIGQVAGLQAALDGKIDDSQFVVLTQAAYTALATKDPNTFYFIPEA